MFVMYFVYACACVWGGVYIICFCDCGGSYACLGVYMLCDVCMGYVWGLYIFVCVSMFEGV